MKTAPQPKLITVDKPKIGNQYTLSWSNNPYMTWTLVILYSDGTCLLHTKDKKPLPAKIKDLRVRSYTVNKPANQLEIEFKHQLILK